MNLYFSNRRHPGREERPNVDEDYRVLGFRARCCNA
jgi:hypothetical protein